MSSPLVTVDMDRVLETTQYPRLPRRDGILGLLHEQVSNFFKGFVWNIALFIRLHFILIIEFSEVLRGQIKVRKLCRLTKRIIFIR